MSTPDVCVAIPSHERPLRLRWLLNSLEEQGLAPERFEIVVCDSSADPEVGAVLATHPLALAGRLAVIRLEPSEGSAARQRNRAWRQATAPLVAFVDDDCRVQEHWLAALLDAAASNPGAIVQGAVRPDPDETGFLGLPFARSLVVDPPNPWVQTANVAYPRELLERLGGFDESLTAGEDTDLAWRATESGVAIAGAPEALAWHTVDPGTLRGRLRSLPRWSDLAAVVGRHPGIRAHLPGRIFMRESHAAVLVGAAGLVAGALLGRWEPAAAAALPYLVVQGVLPAPPKRALRRLALVPPMAAIDVAETWAMVRGSVRHRTLLL